MTGEAAPWLPRELAGPIADASARYRSMASDELDREVDRLLDEHTRLMDDEAINLYAGTNMPGPRLGRVLGSTIASRPSLGHPGDKYEMGMEHAEQLEIMAAALVGELFGARFVEFRVGSGSLANLYAFMCCTTPGDPILALPPSAGGHVTHHMTGAAGLYGLEVHHMSVDPERANVDLDGLARAVEELRPRLIVVGASLCLFPYPVAEVREIAERVGARVLYDAAHVAGLIAGGEFNQPLAEGAHLMTCSTYKSFGGPARGLVCTDDADLAERLDAIAFPGLTANFDLASTAALVLATLDLRDHGQAYARACMANARALAESLDSQGLTPHGVEHGFTRSHHIALPAGRWGGGTPAARRLEPARILASGIGLPSPEPGVDNGLRLGTQEVTRWGMGPDDMGTVAGFLARVLEQKEDPGSVRDDVISFRQDFDTLHHVRP